MTHSKASHSDIYISGVSPQAQCARVHPRRFTLVNRTCSCYGLSIEEQNQRCSKDVPQPRVDFTSLCCIHLMCTCQTRLGMLPNSVAIGVIGVIAGALWLSEMLFIIPGSWDLHRAEWKCCCLARLGNIETFAQHMDNKPQW